jgi:hypothetical protein
VRILQSGTSVCIYLNNNLPFRDAFLQQVANKIRETEHSLLLDNMILAEGDPGISLIDRFGLNSEYRASIKPADFLIKRRVMKNRLIPIALRCENSDVWLEFIDSCHTGLLSDGLFILEIDSDSHTREFKNLKVLRYSEFVTEYDSLLFAGLIAEDDLPNIDAKRYLAAVATSLFDTDAEKINEFIIQFKFEYDSLDYLSEDTFTADELRKRLWKAQVQELFPLIVRETHEIIKRWKSKFEEAFEYIKESKSYTNSLFPDGILRNSYNDPVSFPEEMEIATIYYLMKNRRKDKSGYDTNDYILFIPDEKARERVELLRTMRNDIAHCNVCLVEDVIRLLFQ